MKRLALIITACGVIALVAAREGGLFNLEYFQENSVANVNLANRSDRTFPHIQRVVLLSDRNDKEPSTKDEAHLYVMLGKAVFDRDLFRNLPIYKIGQERLYIPYEFVLNGRRYDGGIAGVARDATTFGLRSFRGSKNSLQKFLIRKILDKHGVSPNVPVEDARK
jgi:hypothetical protein